MQILRWLFYLFTLSSLAFAQINFSTLSGRVVDNAHLFTKEQVEILENISKNEELNSSNQIVIVTLESLEGYDIADYGYQLGRHWGIGQKGKDNGVLFIIAPNERKMRIEVGYGLEGSLSDIVSENIINQKVLPHFKEQKYFKGTKSGLESIILAIDGEYKVEKHQENQIYNAIVLVFMVLMALSFFLIPFFVIYAIKKSKNRTNGNDNNNDSSSSSSSSSFSGGGGSFGGGGSSGSW